MYDKILVSTKKCQYFLIILNVYDNYSQREKGVFKYIIFNSELQYKSGCYAKIPQP